VFEISPDCNLYSVHGTYIKGKVMDNSNYLTVAVNVTKAGAYTITIDALYIGGAVNGYGFTGSGTFLNTGMQTVNLLAQGKPINIHSDPLDATVGDGLRFVAQGTTRTSPSCLVVPVLDDIATYSINCSSISVRGTYLKGTALNSTNDYIEVGVTVSEAGSYSITGTTDAGISFKATGIFAVGSTIVRLLGQGTPTVTADIPISIRANSPAGNIVCSAIAPITLPPMTYAVIGSGDYSWQVAGLRRTAFNGSSFGPSGKVKMVSFNLYRTVATSASAGHALLTQSDKPDIVLYFAYGAPPDATLIADLYTYVRAGGVLIYGTADGQVSQTTALLNGIFGAGAAGSVLGSSNNINSYMINNYPTDPIINGPFGNLAGKFWGEDNSNSIYVSQLPDNSVQICSYANPLHPAENPTNSIVWYNDSYNFVYFGDSTAASNNSTSTTGWPAIYSSTGVPGSKRFGSYATNGDYPYVFNAALELNAVAWGIKKAAVSGINPH
jgi:hypothetical protein